MKPGSLDRHRWVRRRRGWRAALTLIELLVVLAVIALLAGISLPTVKNSLREQRVKRAASQVQAFIEDARARAIASGGGGGVIIDRVGAATLTERAQATRLRLAQSPPAYTGDGGLSKAWVLVQRNVPMPPSTLPTTSVVLDQVSIWFDTNAIQMQRSAQDIANGVTPTLINLGDIIYLGEAGLPLRITGIVQSTDALVNGFDAGGPAGVFPRDGSGTIFPEITNNQWTVVLAQRLEATIDMRRYHRQQTEFVVSRQPRAAIAMPADLPAGTAIDLTVSGIGRDGNEFSPLEIAANYVNINAADNATDALNPFSSRPDPLPAPPERAERYDYESIWIMFGPRGEVTEVLTGTDSVSAINGVRQPILQPFFVAGDIHLLVGRAGEVKTLPDEQLEDNDADPFNDEATDGTTPLLDADSVWVTVKSRSGEVTATPWSPPTLSRPAPSPLTNAAQRIRMRTAIGTCRQIAVEARDGGSL